MSSNPRFATWYVRCPGPDMVAIVLAIVFVGVLPLATAGVCALFIAVGAARPALDGTAFTPAPYQPMEILTRADRTV
jgi:hypothetical protein